MLVATNVSREFSHGSLTTKAVDNVSSRFIPGTFTAIMGPSGSGKSTFLYCLAGLMRPSSGSIEFDGTNIGEASESQLTRLRRDRFGFIFQDLNLIAALTAAQNISLPSLFGGEKVGNTAVREALAKVGLAERERSYPSELSGGEQQRVAVARALAQRRSVVFADEPTGALDRTTGASVIEHFRALSAQGTMIVMVTHDPVVAAAADRVLFLVDGRLVQQLNEPTASKVSAQILALESSV